MPKYALFYKSDWLPKEQEADRVVAAKSKKQAIETYPNRVVILFLNLSKDERKWFVEECEAELDRLERRRLANRKNEKNRRQKQKELKLKNRRI